MFKTLSVFSLGAGFGATLDSVESALESQRFVECGASQEKSVGWIEPRGEKNGALIESVGGEWILKFMVQTKLLPASVVKEAVDKKIEEIQGSTGRKPGKKERREITDDVRMSLLPMAFTKKVATYVWINRTGGLLVVDSGSKSRTDEVLTCLVKSIDGLSLAPVSTQQSPAASMAIWLKTKEAPAGFTSDRDCVLKACDESKAVVKYGRHALDIDEVTQHIDQGKVPTQLAMSWNDRISFVLVDDGGLKKVEYLDVVFEGDKAGDADSGFDADVAIATGELKKLLPDLYEALGGLVPTAEPEAA